MKNINRIGQFGILLFVTLCSKNTWGQDNYIRISKIDTITLEKNITLITNPIKITNITNEKLSIDISVESPVGFKLVTDSKKTITLLTGETQIFPIIYTRPLKLSNEINEVNIIYNTSKNTNKKTVKYIIKNKKINNLIAQLPERKFYSNNDNRAVNIYVKLTNKGNLTEKDTILFNNNYFNINTSSLLSIPAFSDTIIKFEYLIPTLLLKEFRNERIITTVKSNSNVQQIPFDVYNGIFNSFHKSPYKSIPLIAETGIFNTSNTYMYYYGFLGNYTFKDNSQLSFLYRSKQYGYAGNQFPNFFLSYSKRKLDYSAGIIRAGTDFYADGLGMQIGYNAGSDKYIKLTAISNYLSMLSQNNKQLIAEAQYQTGKILTSSTFTYNTNQQFNINSYLISNRSHIFNTQSLRLSIDYGAGINTTKSASNETNSTTGTLVGYNLLFNKNNLHISSNTKETSMNYPGVNSGMSIQSHAVSYDINKKTSVSLYYSTYSIKKYNNNDSSTINNSYAYNTNNYGAQVKYILNKTQIISGYGNVNSTITNDLPEYKIIPLAIAHAFKKFSLLYDGSYIFNNNFGTYKENIFYSRNSLSISTSYGGVILSQSKYPIISNYTDTVSLIGFNNINRVSTYLTASFFRKKLNSRLQYDYSLQKTINEIYNTSTISGNINYNNASIGLDLELQAYYNINSVSNYYYGSLIVRKTIGIPIITHKLYKDFSIILFEDKNQNGTIEKDERPIPNAKININERILLTNEKGQIKLNNIDTGKYVLDFHYLEKMNGLIPTKGFKQTFYISQDKVEYIPMSLGKTIKGHIKVTLDSNSEAKFTNDRIKVTAQDSTGQKFITYTDMNGNFSFSVPESIYTVSLNPEAFDEKFKPVQMSFKVNLTEKKESILNFEIKQRIRQVNKIKADMK